MDNACLMLSEVDRFCASWKETPIQSFNLFFAPKRHCALLKISFLGFFWIFIDCFVAITVIQKFFESTECSYRNFVLQRSLLLRFCKIQVWQNAHFVSDVL
jgi:hypothetical protein